MEHQLSILIPTYNNVCVALVESLNAQAIGMDGLRYEIIVADDGSTDAATVTANSCIDSLPNCKYCTLSTNIGRAAIRNHLGQQAHYEWLLFLDSDVVVENDDFISRYIKAQGDIPVVCGGIKIGSRNNGEETKGNLRFLYEKDCELRHGTNQRAKRPFQAFRTTNFMVRKSTFRKHHFNPSITTYGYEDVLYGKCLHDNEIGIRHIDNPVTYFDYEGNESFVAKTEESIRTLETLYEPLTNYSNIIKAYKKLALLRLSCLLRALYKMRRSAWRANLTSQHPSLLTFKLYKIGYFISIHKHP